MFDPVRLRQWLLSCARSFYYGFTDLLVMVGGSVVLASLWYFYFGYWR